MQVTYFKLVNIQDEEIQGKILLKLNEFMSEELMENNIAYNAGYDGKDETEILFCFLPFGMADKIKEITQEFNILLDYNDITTAVLMDDFENNKIWKEMFNENCVMNFIDILKEFKEKNLTKDIVLDKLNEKGFDSLTDIDLSILNQ